MSKYTTIESGYTVFRLANNKEERLTPDNPYYNKALDMLAKDFNDAHLEQYIDDEEAKKYFGYTIKDKIKSITMKRSKQYAQDGTPYMEVIFETYPRALKMTRKVCDYLNDYIGGQFSDGWGEGKFYPYNSFTTPDGVELAVY